MKLKRINTILTSVLLAAVTLIISCKSNELDVNADWKETMVVYGLLDINADTQFIRVQKAYLNPDQDALEVAKISDSIYYDSLEVLLIDKNTQAKFELEKITSKPKDSGIFAYQTNVLYYTTQPIEFGKTYGLQITNKKTGNVVTSETKIVNNSKDFSPIRSNNGLFNLGPTSIITYKFQSGVNGRVYDFIIRFHYDEISLDDSDTAKKYFDWIIFKNRRLTNSSQSVDIATALSGEAFYQYIADVIPQDSFVYRKMTHCDLSYYGGADDLDVYLSVNRPSLGIVQKKPEYTNINNGLGLFSSRNTWVIDSVQINPLTKEYLAKNLVVKHLNFRE